MSAHKLLLDRIEFIKVSIQSSLGTFEADANFPQLKFDWDLARILHRSNLLYDPKSIEDPRLFYLRMGVRIEAKEDSASLPYEVDVEAAGFLEYVGDEFSGADRFRAVRFSGYQILYGAIREMVANITGRSRSGVLHLPAQQFGGMAKAHADRDEQERQEALAKAKEAPKKRVRKAPPSEGQAPAAPPSKATAKAKVSKAKAQ